MRIIIFITGLLLFSAAPSQAQLKGLLKSAKEAAGSLDGIKDGLTGGDTDGLDVSGGLKEALNKGVESAVTSLSAKDGYYDSAYKLLLPEDVQSIVKKMKVIPGFNNVEEKLIQKMNETAEFAAKEATPIFVDAIKEMSIDDAKSILFGEENAATEYLSNSSRSKLYTAFDPVVEKSMNSTGMTKYWSSVVTKYNKLPFTKDVNPDLSDYVNNSALDGLFGLISVKEKGIRGDKLQRTSPLLKEVFSRLD